MPLLECLVPSALCLVLTASYLTYTRYPDANHGEAADLTFWNPELYEWLLKHERID